jgi:phage gp45-like
MNLLSMLRNLETRVTTMIARGVIERVNDALKTQRLQLSVLADEPEENVEHMQPYGLSFVPPAGAEVLALAPGGSTSAMVAICAQLPGDRPTGGEAGTGGLYTRGAWRLFIDLDGTVHLGAELGASKLAREDRTEAALAEVWTVLQKPCANGVALATGPRTSPSVGADTVRGT